MALLTRRERPLDDGELTAFQALVSRRADREPVAYIVGRRGFRHVELVVDRRVLVPRPETELLVEVGLELPAGARVLDVGTGSGAVALALKHERPDLLITASEVSAAALEVAAGNARRLELEVELVRADLLGGLDGAWDAVLANPPYVGLGERERLAPEIARHEPAGALFAGEDGLAVVRRLVREAAGRTALVAVEVGAGQASAVRELMRGAGFTDGGARRDLAGMERVVIGRS